MSRTETEPANDCCCAVAYPIEECPRDDVAQFHAAEGMDLWCACCGRFWTGTTAEVEAAHARLLDDERRG